MAYPDAWTKNLTKLFPSLDDEGMRYLLDHMSQVTLQRGQLLFFQGDVSDALYVVVKGKVGAFLQEHSGEETFIGPIGVGETVGENGLISRQPRSLTVRALTDCELLKLLPQSFEQFCQEYPLSVLDMSRIFIKRSQQTITKFIDKEHLHQLIALVCVQKTPVYHTFIEALKHKVSRLDTVSMITADDIPHAYGNREAFIEYMEDRCPEMRAVIFCTDITDQLFASIYEGFFDVLILIVDDSIAWHTIKEAWGKFTQTFFPYHIRKELLIIHQEDRPSFPHTLDWLQMDTFILHHHVRLAASSDYDRLLRFFSGKAVGLVLSGGGARGWAHMGALRAIVEHKIPIDAIGGTSIGAIVAGCYATSQAYEACRQKFHAICMSEANPLLLRNLTIPLISLLSSKRGTQSLLDTFGELRIEDLPIPLFCVASNLNHATETIWYRGCLWQKIRGSMAIPGLIPPMVEDGELYVDGGLINNLPVDIMRQVLAPAGTVIAVDVSGEMLDKSQYNFPPALSFVEGVMTLCKLKNRQYKFPSFWGTMMKALSIGAAEKVQANRLKADILIRPVLDPFGFVAIEQGQALVQAGYAAARHALTAWDVSLVHL